MATGNNHLLQLGYILDSPASYGDFSSFARDVEHVAALGYDAIELQLRRPADLNGGLATLRAAPGRISDGLRVSGNAVFAWPVRIPRYAAPPRTW